MIKVCDLQKRFGRIQAVNGVSFEVKKGDVLGFLGPNGAGKSTTMRMITGFLPPSAGKITIGEFDIEDAPEKAKGLIGYLPENAPSYSDMTVEAFLRFTGAIRGLKGAALEQALEKAITTCHLEKVRHQVIDTLSKGFRHRTCFAQAILNDPPILILDEPTDGLDPNQKFEMRELIKTMGKTKAIIVSTHILEEVEAICSRVIIIDRGKVVFNGTPEDLLKESPEAGRVIIHVKTNDTDSLKKALTALPAAANVITTSAGNSSANFVITPTTEAKNSGILAAQVKQLLQETNTDYDELHTDRGRLDEVFRRITSSDSNQEASK